MSDPAPRDSGAEALAHSETGEIESQTAASRGAFDAMVLDGASDESDIEEIAHGHHEEGLLTEDEDYEITEGEEEISGDEGPSGQGFGGSGDASGAEGITLYIPGIGNVPLSSLGSLTQQLRRGPARPAPQQDPAEKPWSALTSLPEPTQDAVLELAEAARRRGQQSVTLLLLGKGGVGKSATVNSLLGERAATVSSFQPTGLKPVGYTRTLPDGFSLQIIDTPSLLERDAVSRARLEEIANAIQKTASGTVDAVLYLDRLDVYSTEQLDEDVLDALTAFFGIQLWDRALLGFTRATDTAPPLGVKFEAWVSQRAEQLQMIVDKVKTRYDATGNAITPQGLLQWVRGRALGGFQKYPTATTSLSPAVANPLPVVLIENHSLCSQNAIGEKVVPGDIAWVTRLYQEAAYLVSTAKTKAFKPDLATATKLSNPDRRRKWLIPVVLATQLGLKLFLDGVMERDELMGDEDGPFDRATQRARLKAYKEDKAVRRHAKKQEKYEQAAAERELAELLGQGGSSEEAGDVLSQQEHGVTTA